MKFQIWILDVRAYTYVMCGRKLKIIDEGQTIKKQLDINLGLAIVDIKAEPIKVNREFVSDRRFVYVQPKGVAGTSSAVVTKVYPSTCISNI